MQIHFCPIFQAWHSTAWPRIELPGSRGRRRNRSRSRTDGGAVSWSWQLLEGLRRVCWVCVKSAPCPISSHLVPGVSIPRQLVAAEGPAGTVPAKDSWWQFFADEMVAGLCRACVAPRKPEGVDLRDAMCSLEGCDFCFGSLDSVQVARPFGSAGLTRNRKRRLQGVPTFFCVLSHKMKLRFTA